MKRQIFIMFIICFLSISPLLAQWISFDGTNKWDNPKIDILSSDDSCNIIEIIIPGMNSTKRVVGSTEYDVLRIPDYYTTWDIGKPQLPAIRELLAVPDFTDYKFSLIDSSIITLDNYNVFPFLKPIRETEEEVFTIDEAFYKLNSFYPSTLVELDTTGLWRDVNVSRLSIFPIRYNPATDSLVIYSKLVLKIELVGISGSIFPSGWPISEEWDELYRHGIINYDFLITGDVEEDETLPTEFVLEQNYPNPFNPSTTINYCIPNVGAENIRPVKLTVYDILGKEVATLVNKEQSAGYYTVNFEASNLSSGTYIYRIEAGNFVQSRKMLLLK